MAIVVGRWSKARATAYRWRHIARTRTIGVLATANLRKIGRTRDSLIRAATSLIARFNSLLTRENFPVRHQFGALRRVYVARNGTKSTPYDEIPYTSLGVDDHWRPRGGMPFAHQRRSGRGERRRDLQHGTPLDKRASCR